MWGILRAKTTLRMTTPERLLHFYNTMKTYKSHRTLIIIITVIILAGIEIIGLSPNVTTPTERLDLSFRDRATRSLTNHQPSGNVVIVAIDDDSFNWNNLQWPWPRAYLAEIVDWLNQAGARVIGLDILLFEPDSDPLGDQALADVLAESENVVLLVQKYKDKDLAYETLRHPLAIYNDVTDSVGIPKIRRDEDAIVRGVEAFQTWENEYFYNWCFELARLYLGVPAPTNPSSTELTFNNKTVPLSQQKLLVNYAGPAQTYPTYSAAYVPLGDYPAEYFKDKIVLIGATTETLQDIYPTPYSSVTLTPGVEIIANAIDTIITESYLHILPPWSEIILIIFAAILAWFIAKHPRPTIALVLLLGSLTLYFVFYAIILSQYNWIIPLIGPELMLFLGVILPSLEQTVIQELAKRRIFNLFGRFISPKMVEQLIETQDINSLNKRANLTILFSDIRGFTSLSEKLNPEEVVAVLNPYLAAMTDIIHKYGGTVDKYEGDAVVAFFGEPIPHPDHALRASRASLEMLVVLDELNAQWKAEGKLEDPMRIGVGLNTGDVFVGLLGSEQRVNYTIIGDNANLAARLQDQTKVYGFPILISESTHKDIKDELETEFVDSASLKGKSELVNIYKLVGEK